MMNTLHPATLVFLLCFSLGLLCHAEETKENLDALKSAGALIMEKEYAEAEEALRALREKELSLSTWGIASFNLGVTLRLSGQHTESIRIFEELLASGVNDLDPADNPMEHYRNYRHKACWEISFNYEAMEDFEKALEYMASAKSKHIFQDTCGHCYGQTMARLERRVQYLNKLKQKRAKPSE